jgi:hypothetical protein
MADLLKTAEANMTVGIEAFDDKNGLLFIEEIQTSAQNGEIEA